MALICLGVAALAALHVRHSIVPGVVLAAVLLIGSATMGSAAISYRVSHPTHPLGFIEDWLQLLGEATALLPAVFIAARHSPRQRTQPGRNDQCVHAQTRDRTATEAILEQTSFRPASGAFG